MSERKPRVTCMNCGKKALRENCESVERQHKGRMINRWFCKIGCDVKLYNGNPINEKNKEARKVREEKRKVETV